MKLSKLMNFMKNHFYNFKRHFYKKYTYRKNYIIVGILFLLVFPLLKVQALEYISVDAGPLYIMNSDEDSAPSPLLFSFGVSIPVSFSFLKNSSFLAEAGILFFGTYYQYTDERAVPAEVEEADTVWTCGIDIDMRFGYLFSLTEKLKFGGFIGVAGVFRIPLIGIEDGGENQGPIAAYLLSRFIYPEVEITLRWNLLENYGLSFSLRGLYPLFHLWDREDLPFYDQLIITGIIGIRFLL